MRKTTGWFESLDTEKRPQWLKDGNKWMLKNIGKPCKVFAVGCVSCEHWLEFTRLCKSLED